MIVLALAVSTGAASAVTSSGQPVSRRVYIDYVTRELNPRGIVANPNRERWGPQYAVAPMAVFSLTQRPPYGEAALKALKFYDAWLREKIATTGGHEMHDGGYLLPFFLREMRRGKLLTPEDEAWFRNTIIHQADNMYAWKPGDGLWRGSHHRAQAQGVARGLAAFLYPDCPKAAEWKSYADTVWNDWWKYRDIGINDTGYFFSSLIAILSASELMGREEVFSDPDCRRMIFDRMLYEISPSGAVIPYGSHGGWNSSVGERIYALEMAAAHTRDGRYKWGAQRMMQYLLKNGSLMRSHQSVHINNMNSIALAAMVCDDTVKPVTPDGRSRILYRREIECGLTSKECGARYPGYGGWTAVWT